MNEFKFNFEDYIYGAKALAEKYRQDMKHPSNRRERLQSKLKHEKKHNPGRVPPGERDDDVSKEFSLRQAGEGESQEPMA